MNNAELYSSGHSQQKRDCLQVLSKYLDSMNWRLGDRVLDLGCGPGSLTAQELMPRLPADFGLLVGADVSSAMIKYARSMYKHPKLRFQEVDLSKDVRDTSDLCEPGFDKIFSFYCLHWIPEQRTAARNIYNLLRSGGETLLIFLGKNPLFEVYSIQCQKPEWEPYMEDFQRFMSPYQLSEDPGEEFNKILQDVGFEVINCECKKMEYNYNNVGCLKGALKPVNPFLRRIPTEQHDEFITDCLMEAMKLKFTKADYNMDDSITSVRYELIVAHARKP